MSDTLFKIISFLAQAEGGIASITALSKALGLSKGAIYNQTKALQGRVIRIEKYSPKYVKLIIRDEYPDEIWMQSLDQNREAILHAIEEIFARDKLKHGMIIYYDSGPRSFLAAKMQAERNIKNVTVITPNPAIAHLFHKEFEVNELYLLGGQLSKKRGAFESRRIEELDSFPLPEVAVLDVESIWQS